jgi:hypothetical protein
MFGEFPVQNKTVVENLNAVRGTPRARSRR